jgi:hypothetical protein
MAQRYSHTLHGRYKGHTTALLVKAVAEEERVRQFCSRCVLCQTAAGQTWTMGKMELQLEQYHLQVQGVAHRVVHIR